MRIFVVHAREEVVAARAARVVLREAALYDRSGSMPRKRELPSAVFEALIVLIALGLMFVAAFAGWAVGHERRHGER